MSVPIHTSVSPTPWRELYAQMLRWRQRMAISADDTDLVDSTHAFFGACFHLRDWLQADASVPQGVGAAAATLVNTDASLKMCADLANGLKHLVLSHGTRMGTPISLSTDNPPTVYDAGGVPLGDAAVIADRCIAVWDAFLKGHGLL